MCVIFILNKDKMGQWCSSCCCPIFQTGVGVEKVEECCGGDEPLDKSQSFHLSSTGSDSATSSPTTTIVLESK